MNRFYVALLCVICLISVLMLPMVALANESDLNNQSSSSDVVVSSSDVSSVVSSDVSSDVQSDENSSTTSDTSGGDGASAEQTSSDVVSDTSDVSSSDVSSSDVNSSEQTSEVTSSAVTDTSSADIASDEEGGGELPPTTLPSDNGYLIHFKDKKIAVKAPEDAFSDGVTMSVTELSEGNTFLIVKNVLSARADRFLGFKIAAVKDGMSVSPSSAVRLNITIPEEYDKERVAVLYVTPTGGVEKVSFVIGENGTADADIEVLGTYVIAELKKVDKPTASEPNDGSPAINGGATIGAIDNNQNKAEKESPRWVSTFLLVFSTVVLVGAAIAGIIVERLRLIK